MDQMNQPPSMSRVRSAIEAQLHAHAQHLRQVRDHAQDGAEIRRLDTELDTIKATLSDLAELDDTGLRQLLERAANTPER